MKNLQSESDVLKVKLALETLNTTIESIQKKKQESQYRGENIELYNQLIHAYTLSFKFLSSHFDITLD